MGAVTDISSCRPGRLVRYNDTIAAVCDGLVRRAGALDDALADYRASCSPEYRATTYATDDTLRDYTSGLRELGAWTREVGRGFLVADAVEAYMDPLSGTFDPEGIRTRTDAEILAELDEDFPDPYLGVPEGMAEALAEDLDVPYDQDEPPAWIDYMEDGGNAAEVASRLMEGSARVLAGLPPELRITFRYTSEAVELWSDGVLVHRYTDLELQARLRLPTASSSRILAASKWVGRVGSLAQFATGTYGQWSADADLDTGPRIGRAVTRGGIPLVTGLVGGAAAGLACGPGAPVCSTVLGIAGALGGAFLGDRFVDVLPWMDEPEEPLPGENDLDAIEDGIASNDLDPVLAANVDLMASDIALEATADDPVFQAEVRGLLPDRGLLEDTINPPEPLPMPEVPTGTTSTTTLPPEPSPGPAPSPSPGPSPEPTVIVDPNAKDPWPTDRPYE